VGWASTPQEAGKSDKASLMIRHFQRTLKLTPGQFRTSLRQMSPSDRRTFYSNLMRVPKHI
jgi:hypothetical protein